MKSRTVLHILDAFCGIVLLVSSALGQGKGVDLDTPFTPPAWLSRTRVRVSKAKLTEKKFGWLVVLLDVENVEKSDYLSNPKRFRQAIKLAHLVYDANPNPPGRPQAAMSLGLYYEGLFGDLPRANHFYKIAFEDGRGSPLRDAPTHSGRGIRMWALVARARLRAKAGQDDEAKRLLASGSFTDWRDLLDTARLYQKLGDSKRSTAAATTAASRAPAGNAFHRILALGRSILIFCENGEEETARRYLDRLAQAYRELEPKLLKQADVVSTKRAAEEAVRFLAKKRQIDLQEVRDGSYSGSTYGYSGPLSVSVKVEGGKIKSVKVRKHQDKRPFGAITEIPRRIIESQKLRVDAISGATITSRAIERAVQIALVKGQR